MSLLKRLSLLLELPAVYRLWQAPFVRAKFGPILRHNDMTRVRRVLDVGCGPGSNAPMLACGEYVGLDINQRYIETARRRFPGTFIQADVRTYVAPSDTKFDFILLNSLLHHLDLDSSARILEQVSAQLTAEGHIHILDLVLPEERCLARCLARADRGDFARSLADWKELFSRFYDPVLIEPYSVKMWGRTLWSMVYYKGRPKR